MSIILKGIDIPKDAEYFSIVFYKKKSYRKEKIMDISEAIQIPKDHGDIKDVSKAIKGWCEGCAFKDTEECADCKDKEMCKYAPTILEAEE